MIQAIEQYGRDTGFHLLWEAVNLPQTERRSVGSPTIGQGLVSRRCEHRQLPDGRGDGPLPCPRGSAPPGNGRLCPPFPGSKTRFLERLEMAAWDWDTGWAALDNSAEKPTGRKISRSMNCVGLTDCRGAGPASGKIADPSPLIQGDYPEAEAGWIEWLHGTLVELVGRMRCPRRFDPARSAPRQRLLLQRFVHKGPAGSAVTTWCGQSPRIGPMPARCSAMWRAGPGGYPHRAECGKCFEWFTAERNPHTQEFLAYALLANFVEEAIEPIQRASWPIAGRSTRRT